MSLAGNIRSDDAAIAAHLEQRALEKLARALCDQTQRLAVVGRPRGALHSREARLQSEVFAERRAQVMQLLDTAAEGVDESRMARLERLIEALECSRDYFMRA